MELGEEVLAASVSLLTLLFLSSSPSIHSSHPFLQPPSTFLPPIPPSPSYLILPVTHSPPNNCFTMLDIFKPFCLSPDGDVVVLEAFRELETDQQVVDDIINVFPNARLVERGPASPSYGRNRRRQW